jgi:glycosyltransferase involved in cell wall biosynthesis
VATIWLIDHYVTTPGTGIGGRHFQVARALASRGHKVVVIAARSHHMLHKEVDRDNLPHVESLFGFDFVRLDTFPYSGAHDKRRILAWLFFATRLWLRRKSIGPRPDAILYVWPQPFGFVAAAWIAKVFKARLALEVRDLWPSTLVEIGNISEKHPFIVLLKWLEKWSVKRADAVVSNLEGADGHLATLGMDRTKFHWIPNGITVADVNKPSPLADHIAAQIPENGLRIVYTGTLGAANALETLIDAIALLDNVYDVAVIIIGEGSAQGFLKMRCKELRLGNVHFLGAIPKSQIQSALRHADVCFIGWKDVSLYKWGIGANKIPEYLYSGKPILHCYSGNFDPIQKFSAGVTVPAENPSALAEAIRLLYTMPLKQREQMGKNGRRAALEYYDYERLAGELEHVMIN